MAPDPGSPNTEDIDEVIRQVGRFSRFVRAGLGVIAAAFVLAVVGLLPDNLDSVSSAVDAVLLPLIFVGMGLLLYGIGMHLHLMHLNLVKQLRKSPDSESPTVDDESES
ncbi:hypothetical protein NGM10_15700 (plasmid) [Halorussus salilacus]|uniref:hypothetical protein n=1 Tax=Halorussus salilacus TaxID=2953750 RepID=UPI0020A10BD9|nr:hypothetical protein [Halorussus salilacus]USZ69848.1 hypothetical protein NGM10_15700 [Halorussus salilacus]